MMTKETSQLIVELRGEQIPSSLQKWGRDLIASQLEKQLEAVFPELQPKVESYSSPCRLVFVVDALPKTVAIAAKKIKGPLVSGNEQALRGFLARHLPSLSAQAPALAAKTVADRLSQEPVGNKLYYFLHSPADQVATETELEKLLPSLLQQVKWPERMNWHTHELAWVRPLTSVVALFDQKLLDFKFMHLVTTDKTVGHWRDASKPFIVTDFATYKNELQKRHLLVDHNLRRQMIIDQLAEVGINQPEPNLVAEVAGLVSLPRVLLCQLDQKYTKLPANLIQAVLAKHQRAFLNQQQPNEFAIVCDWCAQPDEEKIRKGNEAAVNARLEDARFSWENDLQKLETNFSSLVDNLRKLVLHPGLEKFVYLDSSLYGKTKRLSEVIARVIDPQQLQSEVSARLTKRQQRHCGLVAASLAKLDLVSETIREFPSLQGYAIAELFRQLLTSENNNCKPNAARLANYVVETLVEATAVIKYEKPDITNEEENLEYQYASKKARSAALKEAKLSVAETVEEIKETILHPEAIEIIAHALTNQYHPNGQITNLDRYPLARLLAATDRADSLLTLLLVCEKPSGAKDPYALRQHASALVKLITGASKNLAAETSTSVASQLDGLTNHVFSCLKFKLLEGRLRSLGTTRKNLKAKDSLSERAVKSVASKIREELHKASSLQLRLNHTSEGRKYFTGLMKEFIDSMYEEFRSDGWTGSVSKIEEDTPVLKVEFIVSYCSHISQTLDWVQDKIMEGCYELVYHYAARDLGWQFNSPWLYEGQVGTGNEQALGLIELARVEAFWQLVLASKKTSAAEPALITNWRRLFSIPLNLNVFNDYLKELLACSPVVSPVNVQLWEYVENCYVMSSESEQNQQMKKRQNCLFKAAKSGGIQLLVAAQELTKMKQQVAGKLFDFLALHQQQPGEAVSYLDDLVQRATNDQKLQLAQILTGLVNDFLDQTHIASGTDQQQAEWNCLLLLARAALVKLTLPFKGAEPANVNLQPTVQADEIVWQGKERWLHPRIARTEQEFIRYLDKFLDLGKA